MSVIADRVVPSRLWWKGWVWLNNIKSWQANLHWVIPPFPLSSCSISLPPLILLKYIFQPLAILHSTSTTKRKTWALYQPISPASTLWKSGSWTVFLSLTPSLLHQHQIGLQPAWHGAGSQGGWTLTHLVKTNLPPIQNSTVCGWLIFINEFEWNPTRGQRNKVDSAAWWYVPAAGDWRSRDLLFTMSTASSAWDFPVRQKPAGFALRSLQCHIE